MKRNALLIIIALAALFWSATAVSAQKKDKEKLKEKTPPVPGQRIERSLAVSQNAVVTLCMATGNVRVRGWDRPEVNVIASSTGQLELQGGGMTPAQRVEVVLSNAPKPPVETPLVCDCNGVSDLEINLPRGATIEIKTRSGDIDIAEVAEARVDNASGDITATSVARAAEISTLSGDITLSDSSGRIRLRTINGDVDATNIRPTEASNDFKASSTSGDISLENVAQSRLAANTTSGMITMTGRLAQRGSYDLTTFSGDVVVNIPADSSFRLNARAPQGSIETGFAIKSASDEDSQNLLEGRRLTGVVGSGDASLTVQSFSGTVRLQKR